MGKFIDWPFSAADWLSAVRRGVRRRPKWPSNPAVAKPTERYTVPPDDFESNLEAGLQGVRSFTSEPIDNPLVEKIKRLEGGEPHQ